MARVCIITQKETSGGYDVEDTQIIKAIRKIKKKLGMATNNKLAVSPDAMEEYKKKRQGFERKLIMHAIGGLILLTISIILPLISGMGVDLVSIFLVLLLAAFLVGLAYLNYIPPLKKGQEGQTPAQKAGLQKKGQEGQTPAQKAGLQKEAQNKDEAHGKNAGGGEKAQKKKTKAKKKSSKNKNGE